jgi:hypothetical protein
MTNILINLIIAYAEYLHRVEAHHLSRAARQSSPAKVALIHNRVNAITAERQALDAMVRVYIARTHMQPRARKAA